MTAAQIRAINGIVNEFKNEYPDAKVVVKESGNCFISGKQVLNFNSIINEHDKNNKYFIDKMRDFYEAINDGGLNLELDKTYEVIHESHRKNLKFLGKKENDEYVFQEESTLLNPSSKQKHYLTRKEVKNIFNKHV